jgi:hypothetical protein
VKHFRRILFDLPAALSLAILVVVIAAWAGSYRRGDFVLFPLPQPAFGFSACYVATGRGGTVFGALASRRAHFRRQHSAPPAYGNGGWSWATEQFGFDAGTTYVPGLTIYAVVVPDSFLFLLSLGAVGWRVWPGPVIKARRKLRAENSCRHCGYGLSGNVSGVCPQCAQMTA